MTAPVPLSVCCVGKLPFAATIRPCVYPGLVVRKPNGHRGFGGRRHAPEKQPEARRPRTNAELSPTRAAPAPRWQDTPHARRVVSRREAPTSGSVPVTSPTCPLLVSPHQYRAHRSASASELAICRAGQSQGVESNGQGVRAAPRYTSGRLIVPPRPPAPFAGFGDGSTVANSDSIIGTPAGNKPPPDTRCTKRRVAGLAIRELTANGPRVLARRVHLSAPDGFVELGAHARRSMHDQGLARFARMPIHGSSELAQ
jgi:hypothetical protein